MSSGVVSQRTRMTSSPALSALLGRVRVEHDRAGRRAGRRVQAARRDLDLRVRVDHRVQELVELARVDARDRLLAGDQPLVDHLRRRAERRCRGPLPGARLQEVERPLLDRELDVLQVAVVRLEPRRACRRAASNASGMRSRMRSIGSGVRIPATTSSPCAFERNSPKRRCSPVARVAREAHAGARALAAVAEDHLDDVDRRPEVVRDVVCRAGRPARAARSTSRRRRGTRGEAARAASCGNAAPVSSS